MLGRVLQVASIDRWNHMFCMSILLILRTGLPGDHPMSEAKVAPLDIWLLTFLS